MQIWFRSYVIIPDPSQAMPSSFASLREPWQNGMKERSDSLNPQAK